MKRIPYKLRLGIGIGLILCSIAAFIATIIISFYVRSLVVLISVPLIAFICFIVGIIFVPKTNADGPPIVLPPKNKTKKKKIKKIKRTYIDEDEEEDDEMMFIEEYIEDDK